MTDSSGEQSSEDATRGGDVWLKDYIRILRSVSNELEAGGKWRGRAETATPVTAEEPNLWDRPNDGYSGISRIQLTTPPGAAYSFRAYLAAHYPHGVSRKAGEANRTFHLFDGRTARDSWVADRPADDPGSTGWRKPVPASDAQLLRALAEPAMTNRVVDHTRDGEWEGGE